ncbi:unnamed protein product [Schistocephalus solidus]|uniref:Uncharacterized protein n=1 Tax=Schistocephalus solidus TaxID=70667 RepID=A0A3P7ELJ2_SCHSO|nr:unnamed protein product [Schistocephalus solidus]
MYSENSPSPAQSIDLLLERRPLELQGFVVDTDHTKKKRQRLPNLGNIGWPELEFLRFLVAVMGSRQMPLEPQFSL